jgi:hypothetical protein
MTDNPLGIPPRPQVAPGAAVILVEEIRRLLNELYAPTPERFGYHASTPFATMTLVLDLGQDRTARQVAALDPADVLVNVIDDPEIVKWAGVDHGINYVAQAGGADPTSWPATPEPDQAGDEYDVTRFRDWLETPPPAGVYGIRRCPESLNPQDEDMDAFFTAVADLVMAAKREGVLRLPEAVEELAPVRTAAIPGTQGEGLMFLLRLRGGVTLATEQFFAAGLCTEADVADGTVGPAAEAVATVAYGIALTLGSYNTALIPA